MRNTSLIVSDIDFILLMAMQPPPDLRAELERAVVVSPESMQADIVAMGSRVRYIDHISGIGHEVELVYPEDEDSARGHVSILSPTGVALLGRREGQTVGGAFPFTVVSVTPTGSRRPSSAPNKACADPEPDQEQAVAL
ncbi:hypothetical protein B9N43_14365 [Denitratisoma sp. DHT3]|uniref:GreA/GreB family elongation factor n=1 Tax=Denitratisoma sp. DHT3 TaxID=1981880 RepID=UPI0011985AB7|nr:GreA/GreB family elongation factor [Denitratisoma sp. DHT3]QDX82319.1 hypothetical protein B9N43_14365 [Denitratisoma sp. DHT3]